MLTNNEIDNLLVSKNHINNYNKNRLQPASYDMVIGTIFKNGEIINASHRKANDPIIIAPGEVVTMLTLEELDLPKNIAGTAYAMNAQSSEGLLVLNPGHVDPGYSGPLTVVALNLRKVDLALQLGDPIFTIVFESLRCDSAPAYDNAIKTRQEFERKANKKVVEKSIGSLRQLLSITEKDIKKLIYKHWATRTVAGVTAIGALSAVFAAVFGFIAVLPRDVTKSDPQTPVQGSTNDQSVKRLSTAPASPASATLKSPASAGISPQSGAIGKVN